MTDIKVAAPGQLLVPEYDTSDEQGNVKYILGPGTSLQKLSVDEKEVSVIVSSILGQVKIIPQESDTDSKVITGQYLVTVVGKSNEYTQLDSNVVSHLSSLPQENDVVLCRVTKITNRQAHVEIIAVETKGLISKDSGLNANEISDNGGSLYSSILSSSTTSYNAADIGENFKGLIRVQDIRSTERDKLKIFENFQPGDIIRAVIISKGDGTNYYLSTSRNDLGVVFARAKSGEGDVMYAWDWETMIEVSTGDVELRKCAKPF